MGQNVCQYFGRHLVFYFKCFIHQCLQVTMIYSYRFIIFKSSEQLDKMSLYASKSVRTGIVWKSVCIVSCNKSIIFSPVYKSLCTSNISNSKPVHWCISCKPVTALISSKPVKSFVTCKPVCFSNVSIAINFTSDNYCSVTCAEHPVNVISSTVRKSVLSYRTACPVDFGIVVQIANVTLLCTYRYVSFKINHHITPTLISILELPLHSARLAQFSHQHY